MGSLDDKLDFIGDENNYSGQVGPTADGRWIVVPQLGTIWTDDDDAFSLLPAPDATDEKLNEFTSYRQAGIALKMSASRVFGAMTHKYQVDEQSGKLNTIFKQKVSAVTAAATPVSGEDPDADTQLYYITLDDDENVLELVRDSRQGLETRSSGAWNMLDPEDDVPSVFDREWVSVTEAAVKYFDTSEAANTALKRQDFVSYYSTE